ncbi:MAG: GIY-YIG nuclease family protein [Bacteroidia bacterium]
MKIHQYYVYILTNHGRTVLYTGMTNNLEQRLADHYFNQSNLKTFAGKFQCHFLVYYEFHKYLLSAIEREKEIKGWTRIKKNRLIEAFNPDWSFLNNKFIDWPPGEFWRRADQN